jgi:hypothetical protein
VFDAPGAIPAAVDPDHWDINRLQRAVMRLRCDGKNWRSCVALGKNW